ncbi:Kinesin-like protein KIN-8A [Glycine max]|nr:Kinesin-like protein KIN-8A [Glycine max]
MPVSTRSQISVSNNNGENENEVNPSSTTATRMRNPHHGLKEKLKTLTLLYEQQKQASASLKNASFTFKPPPPSEKAVMRENTMPNSTITRTFVLPQPPSSNDNNNDEDAKENVIVGADRIVAFSCPRKTMKANNNNVSVSQSATVARKLSMGPVRVEAEKGGKVGSSRIMVFVRVRPMNKKEKEAGSRCCISVVNRRDVYLTEFANENDYLRLNRLRGRHFTFDAAFPDSATQQEVYSTSTSELVEAVLQGRNGSVFCYGATGAGKTYTMLGTMENPGVMVLAIKDLFSKIRQRSCDGNHVVHLSYLEVYNETVRDLLSPGRPLVLREDKQGIVAAGLTQYRAYSTDEVMALLQQGNQNRTTEPTRANETSSRSERALATDQRTLRSLEGANINRSLLALSSCINSLVEGKKHIPYRNSKLTQLLKDSLGGTCNTVMIANISPSNLSFGETQNTVHWADRAKEIRAKVSDANEDQLPVPEIETDQAKLVLELQKENRELRIQLAQHQQKLLTLQAQSLASHSSPTPPPSAGPLSTPLTSAQPIEKRRTRSSFLAGTCFTPETKQKGAELTIKTLQRTVKTLEAEIEKMRKDHSLQLKQKDDLIRELSQKAPTAKKRSFWDITTTNSPSVTTVNGRKTRSHVLAEPAAPPPSMLLQPGFARQKPNI